MAIFIYSFHIRGCGQEHVDYCSISLQWGGEMKLKVSFRHTRTRTYTPILMHHNYLVSHTMGSVLCLSKCVKLNSPLSHI